jgi:hypothetical protein
MSKNTKKGGNCGCSSKWGGKRKRGRKTRKMKGGYIDKASFPLDSPTIPQNAYYPYNTLAGGPEDPTSANMQPSSRLFPDMVSKGGRKHGRKTKKRIGNRNKKIFRR